MLGQAAPLSQVQLQRMRAHKYKAQGRSLIEAPFQKLWNWQVTFVPHYIHPNLLTLSGAMFILSGLLTMVVYSPDLKQDIPSWCYLFNALCIFLYQSLDAIDGKHARNSGMSSPIGELWDHGFDALIAGALAIEFCMVLKLGNNASLAFISIITTMFSFFSAHWQYYCSGYLSFSSFDVTEVLTISIIGNLLTAIFGQDMWNYQVLPHTKLNELIIMIVSVLIFQIMFFKFYSIIKNKGIGPNGTTVAETSIISPIIPFGIMTLFYLSIFMKSRRKHDIMAKFFVYHLLFTVSLSKIIMRLVISTMSQSEYHFIDTEFIVPTILFLNQYFGYLIPEHLYVIYGGLFLSLADFIVYFTRVTVCVAKNLNINVILVPMTKKKAKKQN